MEEWESAVPAIIGAKGYAGVLMPPKFRGVHALAEMHGDPTMQREMGGLSMRATTARPLAVGRTESGTWLVVDASTMDVLGVGETGGEALADARAHDLSPAAGRDLPQGA